MLTKLHAWVAVVRRLGRDRRLKSANHAQKNSVKRGLDVPRIPSRRSCLMGGHRAQPRIPSEAASRSIQSVKPVLGRTQYSAHWLGAYVMSSAAVSFGMTLEINRQVRT